jgi:thiamine-monophosphate kinase
LGGGDSQGMGNSRRKSLDPDAIVPWLASIFRRTGRRGLLAGVGEDDCGVIRLGRTVAVLSVDFLNSTPIVEQLGLGGERVLGRLVVAATLADLLGSGAVPRALLVAVTVPHGYPEQMFKELMLGVRMESEKWNVPVIAGDTKLGRSRAVLTCGIGTAESARGLFLTNRAKPGDVIFASGHLGTCAAAACAVAAGRAIPEWARRAITVPQLPVLRSRALAKLKIANAGIDISDGLAADLRRMGSASRVGAVLDADRIPINPHVPAVARREGVPEWAFSLASGGDFQFIATVPKMRCAEVEKLGFTQIGKVTTERGFWLTDQGGKIRCRLPKVGHRDRHGQQFVQEIKQIISAMTHE